MSDVEVIAKAVFAGCAANVGPLIGTELELGAVSFASTAEAPQGDLAVIPLSCEINEERVATLTLSSPLQQIAGLGRRMLGSDNPDKEAALSADDLDAIGEVLNLMSGAIDQVVREQLNSAIRSRPLPWWRTPEPGENSFDEGEFLVARGALTIPGGVSVELVLRLPPVLLQQGSKGVRKSNGRVLLLGLEDALREELSRMLQGALMQVEVLGRDAEDLHASLAKAELIMLSGEDDATYTLCRDLRCANDSWTIPTVLCMAEPTQEKILRAIESGISHVLRVPPEATTLLRVLKAANGQEA